MHFDGIAQIIQNLHGPEISIRGILLYGSRLRGDARDNSDYDIVIISDRLVPSRHIEIPGFTFDITYGTQEELFRRIHRRGYDNNNFYLNVFSESVVLLDIDGTAEELVRIATEQFRAGPRAMPSQQISIAMHEITSTLELMDLRIARSCSSTQSELLIRMRIDELVKRSIYTYFCARREWTTGFPILIKRLRNDTELRGHWDCYVESAYELNTQLGAAKTLVHAIGTAVCR